VAAAEDLIFPDGEQPVLVADASPARRIAAGFIGIYAAVGMLVWGFVNGARIGVFEPSVTGLFVGMGVVGAVGFVMVAVHFFRQAAPHKYVLTNLAVYVSDDRSLRRLMDLASVHRLELYPNNGVGSITLITPSGDEVHLRELEEAEVWGNRIGELIAECGGSANVLYFDDERTVVHRSRV